MQHDDVNFMMCIKDGLGWVYILTIFLNIYIFYGLVNDSDWSMCKNLIGFIL
jgi:hypothetical protein